MKVMIVDDHMEVRRMIKSFIEDLIDEFFECADGSEAISAYAKYKPDLVLMDLNMIEMDGFTATRKIKAAFPEARVFIVSQFDSATLRKSGQAVGAESYFIKHDLLPLRNLLEDEGRTIRNGPSPKQKGPALN